MIPASALAGRKVAVFGLARSGRATMAALIAGGAEPVGWDDRPDARDAAAAAGLPIEDLSTAPFDRFAALVLSPGVPLTHPAPHWTVDKANAAGIEIIGDTELLVREIARSATSARLVAVTGTNGKSTTTALIGHLLAAAGFDAIVGGNIGTPVLDLDPPRNGAHYVIEFSSYQIDLTPSLAPAVGILLNISPDHLDRHGSLEHYAAVKARIFSRQGPGDAAIVGVDDSHCRAVAESLGPGLRTIRISAGTPLAGDAAWVRDGVLHERLDGQEAIVADLSPVATLRGVHNWQNAAAAYAAARVLGAGRDALAAALGRFPGLPHRLEQVGRLDGVTFVNDSKATNADAAARALACFDNIYWIAGGRPKAGGIESLNEFFAKMARAYLIGEAADAFAATLDGKVPLTISGTLDRAVAEAAADSRRSGREATVLLSPACASFDQFASFEERGDAFRHAVRTLIAAGDEGTTS